VHSFHTRSGGRPGLRPGSRVLTELSGFDRVTGSLRSILFFNQNDVVLVKKKLTDRNRVFDRVLPGQPGSPIVSSMRHGFRPRSTRRAEPGFKTMILYVCVCVCA